MPAQRIVDRRSQVRQRVQQSPVQIKNNNIFLHKARGSSWLGVGTVYRKQEGANSKRVWRGGSSPSVHEGSRSRQPHSRYRQTAAAGRRTGAAGEAAETAGRRTAAEGEAAATAGQTSRRLTKESGQPILKESRPEMFILSLLSDSNQRPRDYKSRALAN